MSPLERISGLALRHLSPERMAALREAYMAGKRRLDPVLRLVHGSFDTAALRDHLEERVGRDFEVLMVHSSVNHMRPMYTGEPLDLVRMLIDFVGPKRTLAMPAFYFGDPAIGGAHATFVARPRFDLRRTPSQMGLATELFRRSPGVLQSRHPVYRVSALGPMAADLVRGHEFADTPAGLGTPFEFMAKVDTCVIGIGKPMQVLTQAHHTEHAMGADFPVPSKVAEPLPMTLVDGAGETPFMLRSRGFQGRFDIWRLRQIMAPGTLQEWRFHHVPMFATRARSVSEQLHAAALRGVTLYLPE